MEQGPDLMLLRAGWERCGDRTSPCYGLYRRTDIDDPCWVLHKTARAIAFGEEEQPEPAMPDEEPIRVLLQRILEELQKLNRAIGGRLAL